MKVLLILGFVCFLVVGAFAAAVVVAVVRARAKQSREPESGLAAMFRQGREESARRQREANAALSEDDPLREWVARDDAWVGWVGFDGTYVTFREEPGDLLGEVRGVRYGDKEPNFKGLPSPGCSFGIDLAQSPASNRGLGALAEHPDLTALNLFNHLNVDDASLKVVRRMTGLVMLDLQVTNVTAHGIEHLAELPALRYLAVKVTEDFALAVRHLREMTQLAALVGGSAITDKDLRGLAPLTHLTHLELSSHVSNAGVRHLQAFPRLLFLKLASYQFTDEGLAALPALGALQKLELTTGDEGVRGSGFAALARLPELQELRLAHNALTGAGFEHFAGLSRLRKVDLSNNPIGDSGLARLRVPPGLEDLGLGTTKLTDAGVARLELPPSVLRLNLEGNAITDACVPHLARLTSLQYLDIMGTQLTLPGAERLSEALPYCTIQTSFPK